MVLSSLGTGYWSSAIVQAPLNKCVSHVFSLAAFLGTLICKNHVSSPKGLRSVELILGNRIAEGRLLCLSMFPLLPIGIYFPSVTFFKPLIKLSALDFWRVNCQKRSLRPRYTETTCHQANWSSSTHLNAGCRVFFKGIHPPTNRCWPIFSWLCKGLHTFSY